MLSMVCCVTPILPDEEMLKLRWQLTGDWPVGQFLVPAGTVLSAGDGEAPTWNGIKLPLPMPLNATALDEEGALQMCAWHGQELWHRLVFAAGVDRTSVFVQARWPNPSAESPRSRKRK
jgi:hypothetical protein